MDNACKNRTEQNRTEQNRTEQNRTEQNRTEQNREYWIDLLNIYACISVVFMHANNTVHTFSNTFLWKSSLLVQSIFYPAVPIFFMITGMTLIDYREKYNTKDFFIKRIKRTVIPFLFWSLFALLFKCYFYIGYADKLTIRMIINSILSTKIEPIYWFFLPLWGVYLSIPVLSCLEQKIRVKLYCYCAVCSFLVHSLLPTIGKMLSLNFSIFSYPITTGYMIYVLLGYVIYKRDNISPNLRRGIYILGLVGFLLRFYSCYTESLKFGKYIGTLGGYLNFPTVFYAVAVFVFFKFEVSRLFNKTQIKGSLVSALSECSFGVYLIHIFLLYKLPGLLGISYRSIGFRTIGAVFVYIICVGITMMLKKLKFFRNIV